jgi:hypothetical protein
LLVTVSQGAEPGADPAATKLLASARAKRAVWEKFPGFTAKVTLKSDEAETTGSIAVTDEGVATLKGVDATKFAWAKPLMKVVIDHRMPSAPVEMTPCKFGKEGTHPMGREVVLIGDGMGSKYRIRDEQVLVVSREGPGPRFTTTVQNTEKTPEGKYLPTAFVITYWTKEGEVLKSDAHTEAYSRVGGFDLPTTIRVVSATKTGVTVREVTLSEHRLNTAK